MVLDSSTNKIYYKLKERPSSSQLVPSQLIGLKDGLIVAFD